MKYAITGPQGAIFNIVDVEPTNAPHYSEISDADAATVEASEDRFFIVDGVLYDNKSWIAKLKREYANEKIDKDFSENLEGAKKLLRDHYAEYRYEVETGGLDMGGLAVRTDRHTVARIYQANTLAIADPTFTTEWKLGDGTFITVDATLISQLSASITAHIQASFAQEKAVNALIDSATTIEDLNVVNW